MHVRLILHVIFFVTSSSSPLWILLLRFELSVTRSLSSSVSKTRRREKRNRE
ncbi:hypothetical protein CSUI_004420 [Cystoisospora suis]|uniref:Transmembrane protein n=1 Tax=Cystoisospora suis TaxID=483139 RepID=A0A2C6L136_9APIC|nr:hypothetical protein CSUI_004420 [Cystoisospora suis]